MFHRYSSNRLKQALVFAILMMSAAAHGTLLDCPHFPGMSLAAAAECASVESLPDRDQSYSIDEATPTPPIKVGLAGYQVNEARTSNALTESAPLLALLGALLAVVMVRAKSHNSK